MNYLASSTTQSGHVTTGVARTNSRFHRNYSGLLASLGIAAFLLASAPALAATAPPLLTASSFGVLAGSAVTAANSGTGTVITGDLGIHPSDQSSVTGFTFSSPAGAGQVLGATHFADGVANQAKIDATAANTTLANLPCGTTISADLATSTLTPGVYCSASSMGLSGTLTLNAQNDPNAVFIFQMGTTLTTASASKVVFINGGSACNVFWQVGSSATLGTGSQVVGTIIADASITLTTGASLAGRAFALTGAVTMDTTSLQSVCALPTVTVTKVSIGDVGTFNFTGDNGFGSQAITTGTPGTGVPGATRTLTTAGGITTITESTLPTGFTLTAISCSGQGAGAATPDLVARSVTLDGTATAAGAAIACTFTNTFNSAPLPTVTVTKVSNGGVGTFNFTGDNGFGSQAIITETPGTGVPGAPRTLTTTGGITTITESTPPTGFTLTSIRCSGQGEGAATPDLVARSVTLDRTATAAGATIACTFTNTFSAASEVTPIPTLSEWAMIALAGLLAIVGFVSMRRRVR